MFTSRILELRVQQQNLAIKQTRAFDIFA